MLMHAELCIVCCADTSNVPAVVHMEYLWLKCSCITITYFGCTMHIYVMITAAAAIIIIMIIITSLLPVMLILMLPAHHYYTLLFVFGLLQSVFSGRCIVHFHR